MLLSDEISKRIVPDFYFESTDTDDLKFPECKFQLTDLICQQPVWREDNEKTDF